MKHPCALCSRKRPVEEMTFSRYTRARYCAKCRKSNLQVKPEPPAKTAKSKRERLVTEGV